jgi:transcriptional regulator with XRE-family HTH domain
MATFGQRLKSLREEKDLKQVELKNLLSLSSSATISQWESDKRLPDAHTLERLAEIFDCSVDYLLGRSDIRNPRDKISEALKDSPDLLDFWKEISRREDLQLLFKQARELKPETIKKVVEVIKLIEDEEAEQ